MADRLLNQKEFARWIGVSPPTANSYCKRGLLGDAARKVDGKWQIDPERAKENLRRAREPDGAGHDGPVLGDEEVQVPTGPPADPVPTGGQDGGVNSYSDARFMNEKLKAAMRTIELRRLRGELVPKDDVRRDAYRMYRNTRDALLNVPSRVAGLLVNQADITAVEKILTEQIKVVLDDLAKETDDFAGADAAH